jgi:hypothetical protein
MSATADGCILYIHSWKQKRQSFSPLVEQKWSRKAAKACFSFNAKIAVFMDGCDVFRAGWLSRKRSRAVPLNQRVAGSIPASSISEPAEQALAEVKTSHIAICHRAAERNV